jgi:hypothetical protein
MFKKITASVLACAVSFAAHAQASAKPGQHPCYASSNAYCRTQLLNKERAQFNRMLSAANPQVAAKPAADAVCVSQAGQVTAQTAAAGTASREPQDKPVRRGPRETINAVLRQWGR